MKKNNLIYLMSMSLIFTLLACQNELKTTEKSVEDTIEESNDKEVKEVLLVKYHADWCGSCKALTPLLSELNAKLSDKNSKYIELDLTDESTTKIAEGKVSEFGISPLNEKQKTGYVSIIDANSKQVLGKLTKTQSVEEMYQQVIKLL